MDTASSGGGDKNVLTGAGGQVRGQEAFGGTRVNDRSVSTFDQRHVIHGTVIYDLPFGKGRQLANNIWNPLDWVVGGWPTTALVRLNTGFPYMMYLSDTNQLAYLTHSTRPELIPELPI